MIRIASLMAGLLLMAGCAAHREPTANCWQHRVAFVADPLAQRSAADCTFAPLPALAGPVDV